jgi:hypothetical protein
MKSFLQQLLIILCYLSLTCYEFVAVKTTNPIGIGFQQVILILLHFSIIVFYGILLLKKTNNSKYIIKNFFVNLVAFFTWISLYFAFNALIWEWLWKLRS